MSMKRIVARDIAKKFAKKRETYLRSAMLQSAREHAYRQGLDDFQHVLHTCTEGMSYDVEVGGPI